MNRKIIQKLIDEFDKPTPRLDYIRGVLETAMEALPEENVISVFKNEYKHIPPIQMPNRDNVIGGYTMTEAEVMDAKAKAALKAIQEMNPDANNPQ